ncbi:MAG: hypothetical protein CVV64_20665 [Candidatus Wallbacteria bacterium HGW-Wallbacteria-1]|uniref:Uncharacterized protein n=1 Tax=Candidatus Wallbacteria bacterium HGW-Wallbacteria-1 TaxID=2013854 RepID=A0A2N1PI17_9BACT|nr:MAG: hypothetical protein CVV64_20665 [Candidatus Wallbacteria bacterium HGW-Wallbacteria-1]PKL26876.1 MAG: hypothetical protein CVV46_14705 [Spirochaetae bacterium HGW-Spirochaetae-2]
MDASRQFKALYYMHNVLEICRTSAMGIYQLIMEIYIEDEQRIVLKSFFSKTQWKDAEACL